MTGFLSGIITAGRKKQPAGKASGRKKKRGAADASEQGEDNALHEEQRKQVMQRLLQENYQDASEHQGTALGTDTQVLAHSTNVQGMETEEI